MRTVRILALDGGGIRGIFSATFLERFCRDAGINGKELWNYFDIICGTSIGGIQTIAYAHGLSPTELKNLLIDNGPSIFTIRFPPYLEGPAGAATFAAALITPGTDPYIYDSAPLRRILAGAVGSTRMFQLKTNVLITSVGFTGGTVSDDITFPYGDINTSTYNHFSNVLIPGFTSGQNYSCVDVGVATGSAPVFFPPTQISNDSTNQWYIDGGLYQNNPTALGYTLSSILFPEQVKTCILSVGTGYEVPDFAPASLATFLLKQRWIDKGYSPEQIALLEKEVGLAPQNSLSLLSNSLALTLTGAQDAVDEQFRIMSLYKGATNNLSYYRFQRLLTDKNLAQLDNPTNAAIKYLQDQANAQYDLDALKIQLFIQKLQG